MILSFEILQDSVTDQQMDSLSPEIAYKFFNQYLTDELRAVLTSALLLPGVSPEKVADLLAEYSAKAGEPLPMRVRTFTIKALEHFQFLAQVDAGIYGDKEDR